jgi:glycosyltransferase involved in cell wall biosynthesis
VQDHLVQRGGAERALLSMLKAAPDATIFTPFFEPAKCFVEFEEFPVRTSRLNQFDVIRSRHRAMLPILPLLFSRTKIDADVVVCGTSGWAQGIHTDGRKVVYFHSLARWIYDREDYVKGGGMVRKVAARALAGPLERWDRRTVASGTRFMTQSTVMQRRLREIYGIEAEILPPPNTFSPGDEQVAVPGVAPGFFLIPARLVPYKNVDVLLAAFVRLPGERLVVAGDGPLFDVLRTGAPANVTFLGNCDDPKLRWLYANCAAVVSAAVEPFGMTPVEAAAFGRPTIALREGGFVDTVLEGETGLLFDEPDPASVATAIERFRTMTFDEQRLRANAELYREDAFVDRLRTIIAEAAR